jgi:predicted outer membrane repeat protein
MWRSALISTIALLLLAAAGAPALTIHVPDDQPSIQAGIDAASAGDIVLVTCDTYYEHDIVMKSGVTLASETGEADCVTIDAQEQGRVLHCDGVGEGTVVRGFTLTGGSAFDGGGVRCGGGSTPLFENVLIQANDGVWCGGMWCGEGSTPTLVNVAFIGNRANDGDGVALVDASPDWGGVLFAENSASVRGGGLFCIEIGYDSVFEFCTFSGNSATNGGGLCLDGDSSPDVVHCTFVGNSATEHGGGAYCE